MCEGHNHDHNHPHTHEISVEEKIYAENDRIAAENLAYLAGKRILAVNVMGSPGAGKTTSLLSLIKELQGIKIYVIEGDIESDLDTKTLLDKGIEAVQINTGGACHLDALSLKAAFPKLSWEEGGILFIENVGNLVCPAEFEIGEHLKMLVCSVAEGSDKPYKYPLAFEKADLILLSKKDLKPYVDFDDDFFYRGVRALNPNVPVFEVNGRTGEGFAEAAQWLKKKMSK